MKEYLERWENAQVRAQIVLNEFPDLAYARRIATKILGEPFGREWKLEMVVEPREFCIGSVEFGDVVLVRRQECFSFRLGGFISKPPTMEVLL